MSTMPPRTSDQQAPPPPADRLSVTQIVASLLATVTATSALSLFGVAGTLIGAGLASVLTVVGNHVYTESIKRTRAQVLARTAALRTRAESPDADPDTDSPADRAQPQPPAAVTAHRTLDLGSRRRLLLSILAVFVAILAAITVFELVVGRTVSQVVRDEPGRGTSLGGYTDSPTSTKSSSSSPSSTSPSSTSSTTSSTTPVQTTATSSSTTGTASSSSTSATTSPSAPATSTGVGPTSQTPAPTTTGG